jgi:putative DNA primase/helicase
MSLRSLFPEPPTSSSVDFGPLEFAHAARIAGAVSLANVEPTSLDWLWPGRIPLGHITMLASDPGLGKSLLTLDLAARISRGQPWPDQERADGGRAKAEGKPEGRVSNSDLPRSAFHLPPSAFPPPALPGSVLLLTAEDSLADTIRPRLEALGADCTRIHAIPAVPGHATDDGLPRAFELRRDLARLKRLLAAMKDCRLVVVDPISAYLGGINEHANSEVKKLLMPLAAMAREHKLAVVAVSHLRKKDGAAIYRTMGSLAFVAAARAAWVVSRDPDDGRRRLLLPLKNNLAPDATGLAYTIETLAPGGPPVVRWSPETIQVSAETLVGSPHRTEGRPDHERQDAIAWLHDKLAAGPCSAEILQVLATLDGINPGTLRRAFRDLRGEAVRQGFGPGGQWSWKLPTIDAQNPGGEFCASMDKTAESRTAEAHTDAN